MWLEIFEDSIVIFPPLTNGTFYSLHYVQWFLLNRTEQQKKNRMVKKKCDGVLQQSFAFTSAIVLPSLVLG